MPQKEDTDNRHNEKVFLLFSYAWSSSKEGMALVNRSLALSLVRFKNVKIYSTILQPENEVEPAQIKDAKENGVTLIFANQFPQLKSIVPNVTHIVAHSPLMIDAVQVMRTELYPDSKLILFYHIIPSDVHPFVKALPQMPASEEDLIQDAETADIVYSVTERVFNYFEPRFRNRSSVHVNHKIYHPQCPLEFFSMSNKPFPTTGPFKLLVQTTSDGVGQWNGVDIASWCGVKLAQTASTSSSCRRAPELTVGGMIENKKAAMKEVLADFTSTHRPPTTLDDEDAPAEAIQLKTNVHYQKNAGELLSDLSQHALCLLPTRAEPFGCSGLQALSAGIPTLLSDDCFLAPVVRKLSTEPDYFLVPVTKDTAAARQDGSAWRDRVLGIMQDPQKAYEMAYQLKMALKRDEPTKVSHDSFIWHCLGGIALKHELKTLELKFYEDDEKELQIRKNFNAFLLNLLKQCWRLKHDPLTTEADLFPLVPDVQLPVRELIREVTDRIEEFDRCIVAADDSTGVFIVYCPTADSLSDLWAMCDRINGALTRTLLSLPEPNPVLDHFRLRNATFRTIIDGSEFLKLKQSILASKANGASDEQI